MFERCKKIDKEILYTKQDCTEGIPYRGEGLSNEYRLILPSGLLGHSKATSFTRVFDAYQERV